MKLLFAVALTFGFTGCVYAQVAASDSKVGVAPAAGISQNSGGTTLHKKNKVTRLRGASAAAAASAMGTNDKGQQH